MRQWKIDREVENMNETVRDRESKRGIDREGQRTEKSSEIAKDRQGGRERDGKR